MQMIYHDRKFADHRILAYQILTLPLQVDLLSPTPFSRLSYSFYIALFFRLLYSFYIALFFRLLYSFYIALFSASSRLTALLSHAILWLYPLFPFLIKNIYIYKNNSVFCCCFLQYQTKLCIDSAVWLLHGWRHLKLLPSRRKFCIHRTTIHQFTVSLHSKIHTGCICV